MTQLTAQEIKLQQKYAELRRKKEEKRKQAEEAKSAAEKQSTAGNSTNALNKAKAILARKADSQQKLSSSEEPASTPKVDPILAAKRALEEKKKGAAPKAPSLKRPTVQRVAPKHSPKRDQADASSSPHSTQTSHHDSAAHRPAKRQAVEDERHRASSARQDAWEVPKYQPQPEPEKMQHQDSAGCSDDGAGATLFVGDLPPYYTNDDLHTVFAQLAEVEEVRVMGTQCYAFVRFQDPAAAQSLVQRFAAKPLIASGHELRINLAHGQLPDWKRMPGHSHGPIPRGQQHPKVLQAQQHGDALAQQLLAAGSHGLDFRAQPCQREMVSYDDL